MVERGGRALNRIKTWGNSRWLTIGKWGILLGMVYLAFRFLDLKGVVEAFGRVSPLIFVVYMGLLFVTRWLYAFRWHLICSRGLGLADTPVWFLLRTNLLAEFVGIAMPSSLGGEAVRILKLSGRIGNLGRSAASVAADRLIGLLSMAAVTLVLLPGLGIPLLAQLPVSPLLVLAGILTAGMAIVAAITWWGRRSEGGWVSQLRERLEFSFGLTMGLVLLTAASHLLFAASYYLIFQEIWPLPLMTVVPLVLTAQLARSIPVSMLGIGLSEGSLVALGSLVGVPPEAGLAIVVVSVFSRYVFATSGVLIELYLDGKKFLGQLGKSQASPPELSQWS